MHVDREFVIDGLGLVVTGTALCGSVSAGETVCVVPAGRRARVRSVRANSADADRAGAGERCALALQGLSRGEVRRGDTIVSGEGWPRSRRIDVLFQSLHGQAKPARRATAVSVHLGTAAYPAQLAPLGEGFARLTLAREVSAWHGERFLVRDTGSQRLLGGGAVVDPQPPERGAARPERIAFLRAAAGRPAEAAFRALLDADPGVVDVDWLAGAWHLAEEEVLGLTGAHDVRVFAARGRRCAVSAAAWNVRCAEMLRAIVQWHAEHPDWIGARLDDLRKLLGARWSDASGAVAQALVAEGALGKQGPYYKLPEHRPVLSPADEALWKRVAPLLEGAGGRPPRVHELSGLLTMEPPQVLEILERAARAGLCYRVAPNRFFLPAAVSRLAALAAQLDAASNGEGFSAAQYRDASGLGRNLAIQVLEFLDELGATRRHGELRRALAATILDTEEQRTPVGRPDFKSGERRLAPLASSTPASSATPPQGS